MSEEDDLTFLREVRASVERLARRIMQIAVPMIVAGVLDVALTIGLVVAVSTINEDRHASCQRLLESQARQKQLFLGLLDLPTTHPPSPEAVAAYKKIVNKAYPPHICK